MHSCCIASIASIHATCPMSTVCATEHAHLLNELSTRCTGHGGVWSVCVHPSVRVLLCVRLWLQCGPPDGKARKWLAAQRPPTPPSLPDPRRRRLITSDDTPEDSGGGRAQTPCRVILSDFLSDILSDFLLPSWGHADLIGCVLICFDLCYLHMVWSAYILMFFFFYFEWYAEEFHWLIKCFICACCAGIFLISIFGVFLFALDLRSKRFLVLRIHSSLRHYIDWH